MEGLVFPRDTWAFEKISQKVGLTSGHMLANEDINKVIISNIYSDVLSNSPSKIGLIGLRFKPRTTVITEGTAYQLMSLLYKFKGEIHLYDHLPECIDNFKNKFKEFKKFVFHKTCKTLLVLGSMSKSLLHMMILTYDESLNLKVIDIYGCR